MNTTDNEIANNPSPSKEAVTSADAKKMKSEYIQGVTIDDLADTYGYDPKAVEKVVVEDVSEDEELPTQAELDKSQASPTKKGK